MDPGPPARRRLRRPGAADPARPGDARWALLPHARTQSVRITQGPWQRLLSLTSVWFDSTPGPVTVVALQRSAADARELAQAQAGRAATARAGDRTIRWANPTD